MNVDREKAKDTKRQIGNLNEAEKENCAKLILH